MKNLDYFPGISRQAVAQQPPPCEKYDCPHVQRCKTRHLACQAFHFYVMKGRSLDPCTVFQKENRYRGKKRKIFIHGPLIHPTREIYDKIYKAKDDD